VPPPSRHLGDLVPGQDVHGSLQHTSDFIEAVMKMRSGPESPRLQNDLRAAQQAIRVLARHLESDLGEFAMPCGCRVNNPQCWELSGRSRAVCQIKKAPHKAGLQSQFG
jgi:hypothetical protein